MGESFSANGFNCHAAITNNAEARSVKAQAKPMESSPVANARIAVRGLRRSYSRSAMRFMVIAAERAPTIATMIQRICQTLGKRPASRAASRAPTSAKGRAKTECSNLIISSTIRSRPFFAFGEAALLTDASGWSWGVIYRLLEFCMLFICGSLRRVLIAEPCIRTPCSPHFDCAANGAPAALLIRQPQAPIHLATLYVGAQASAIGSCTASRLAAFPAVLLFLGQAELGEDAVGELFDEIVDFFRAVVEGWHRGHHGGSCVVHANHVFEVNAVQRGLAQAED